jgi:exosome complex exonuclease DIS3/RRP44
VVFYSFDPVTVRLSLDSSNIQHEKLVFQLIKPFIEGFSVVNVNDDDVAMNESLSTETSKRKSNENSKKTQKKKRK